MKKMLIYLVTFALLITSSFLVPETASASSAVTINSISCIYSDGVGVVNGIWTGQPSRAPSNASNRYKGCYAVESQNYNNKNYYWDINGSNFTNTMGSVWLLGQNMNPISNLSINIVSWSNNKIRVVTKSNYNFTYYFNAYLAISLDKQQPRGSSSRVSFKNVSLVGVISGRGYGQCTWYVANTRLNAGKSIPPSAYSTIGSIPPVGSYDNGYVPQLYDCLTYGNNHVAIILSNPYKSTNNGRISWSFTLGEMNAKWDECASTSYRTYVLSAPNSKGQRSVVSGIGTNASSSWAATGFYR